MIFFFDPLKKTTQIVKVKDDSILVLRKIDNKKTVIDVAKIVYFWLVDVLQGICEWAKRSG